MFKKIIQKKYIILLLCSIALITIFLNTFNSDKVPGCLNPDEPAFGYNAYSILNTLKDEHGNFMPMRLRSFDDFKMPLYSYLSIPFISIFGMTESSIRLLNIIVAVGLVFVTYFLFKKLTDDQNISLLGSFFATTSIWTLIVSRHAHEALLTTLLIAVSSYFAVSYLSKNTPKNLFFALIFALLSAFSYHFGRIYLLFIAMVLTLGTFKNQSKNQKIITVLLGLGAFLIPFMIDLQYGVNRLNNLAFYKNIGFVLRINEYLNEHNLRLIHNKIVEGIIFITNNYLRLLSPDFLVVNGDLNQRFGFTEMGPLTPVVYICAIIGLFALFRNKNKYRYFIGLFVLVAQLGSALTWQPVSLTRTFFMIIPVSILASYGFFDLSRGLSEFIKDKFKINFYVPILLFMFLIHVFYLMFSMDIYFFHYFNRTSVQKSWQCGNKEMAEYVKENYGNFDKFYISTKNGQPYIYLLYFNKINPTLFQDNAVRTRRDEYGFTQVEKFDKFEFKIPANKDEPRSAYIGFKEEIGDEYTKTLQYKATDVFFIKENR